MTPQERFEKRIEMVPWSGCWLWLSSVGKGGYGMFYPEVGSQHGQKAHRSSWEIYKGSIPSGLSVLHRCDVRSCVNPAHLFLGTQRDNVIDAWAKGRHFVVRNGYAEKTHCKNGHELTEGNVYLEAGKYRKCKECRRAKNRRYEQRKKT